MSIAFRAFPNGVVALFDEPNTTGDIHDIDAPRNAPAKTPSAHLDKVYFHASLDYMEVVQTVQKTLNHSAVSAPSLPSGFNTNFGWGTASADHLLATTGLGYVAIALVAVGTNILWPGVSVQADLDGGGRYASVYVTTTEVRLYEWASTGIAALPAISLDYQVIVIRDPRAASGHVVMGFDPTTGIATMGFGKFDSSRAYLQVAPGGSPLALLTGRSIDLNNGAVRSFRADGTEFEPVPGGLKGAIVSALQPSVTYGASMAYAGSYAAPAAIQVQAP